MALRTGQKLLALQKLEARLAKLSTSTKDMQEIFEEFVTCDCMERARRLGKGPQISEAQGHSGSPSGEAH